MLTFEQQVSKLINQYKLIQKKQLGHADWKTKITELKLRRKDLRLDNEVSLYHKAKNIVQDMNNRVTKDSSNSCWYSGIDEFHQHFANFLAEYQVEGKKVINASQIASRALVDSLQLINLTNNKTPLIANKLSHCGELIAKYGSLEQQTLFAKALRNFQAQDLNFFSPLSSNFGKYIQQFATLFSDNHHAGNADFLSDSASSSE